MASARFGAPKFQPIIEVEDQGDKDQLAPLLLQETRGAVEVRPPILYPVRKLRNLLPTSYEDKKYLEDCKLIMDRFSCSGFYSSVRTDSSQSNKFRLLIGKRDLYDELSSDSVDALFPRELSRFFSKKQRTTNIRQQNNVTISLSSLSSVVSEQATQLEGIINSLNAAASSLKLPEDEGSNTLDGLNKKKETKTPEEKTEETNENEEEEEQVSDDFAYSDSSADDSGNDYTKGFSDDDDDFSDDNGGDDEAYY